MFSRLPHLWLTACLLAAAAFFFPEMLSAADGRLSTHILDISRGQPAPDVPVTLFRYDAASDSWQPAASGRTDGNGRLAGLLPEQSGTDGVYKFRFETSSYFASQNQPSIYPYIEVVFRIGGEGHFHIPITVSANGYSTYRGS